MVWQTQNKVQQPLDQMKLEKLVMNLKPQAGVEENPDNQKIKQMDLMMNGDNKVRIEAEIETEELGRDKLKLVKQVAELKGFKLRMRRWRRRTRRIGE